MALNFLTGSRTSEEEAPEATEPENTTTDTTEEDESPAPARRRRGSRGGRSRSSARAAAAETETADEEPPAPRRAGSRRRASDDGEEAPPARPSRRRSPAAKADDTDEEPAPRRPTRRRAPAAKAAEEEEAPAPRPSRRRAPAAKAAEEDEAPAPRPSRRRAPAARTAEEDDAPAPRSTRRRAPAAKASDDEPEAPRRAAPRRRGRAAAAEDTGADAALLDALKAQTEQLARLVELQERAIERLSGNGKAGVGTMPRVGVFVDSANVELARDRNRGGRPIDWGLVLERVTEGRRLVRAIAYSPVHDDPGVSPETQRFVEPFLGKGFKIVTKPLKRFADGSIKANVDIELALDVITMAERLDVAVLVSGDGDFQHLVEVLQSRGIRVEVAGLGQSVAGNLKKAADRYIELDFAQKK